jgi:hypothetical protein
MRPWACLETLETHKLLAKCLLFMNIFFLLKCYNKAINAVYSHSNYTQKCGSYLRDLHSRDRDIGKFARDETLDRSRDRDVKTETTSLLPILRTIQLLILVQVRVLVTGRLIVRRHHRVSEIQPVSTVIRHQQYNSQ